MSDFRTVLIVVLCNCAASTATVADDRGQQSRASIPFISDIAEELTATIEAGIDRQSVVGAQLALGTSERLLVSRQYGVIAPGGDRPVDDRTLFCIGSCSKPIIAACLMSLVDEGSLSLDEPVSRWMDAFEDVRDEDGRPVDRPPTVRELLAHRGGIYSQRRELTPAQERAIRDFRLSLAESVEIISRQPLISPPGTSFQYSGAGYCVLGRVAELASETTIEELLQSRMGAPLQWTRTTFFPAVDDANVAAGGKTTRSRVEVHPQSPHLLGDELRLPLVGGSIHSTAEESARFARMLLSAGRFGRRQVLSEPSCSEWTRRQFDDGNYGLGWSLQATETGETAVLSHGGALHSSRSLLSVNLADGYYVVVHWTLSDPGAQDIRDALQNALRRAG